MSLDCGGHGEHASSTQKDSNEPAEFKQEPPCSEATALTPLLHPVHQQRLFFLPPSIHHTLVPKWTRQDATVSMWFNSADDSDGDCSAYTNITPIKVILEVRHQTATSRRKNDHLHTFQFNMWKKRNLF